MLKKIVIILTVAIFSFIAVTAAVQAKDKGNKRKGKFTYRKIYKECHARDASIPLKPPINPDAKTQAQWDRVFDKKEFDMFGCKEEWSKLSEADIVNIHAYLHSGAADSPTPAKCK